MKLYFIKNPSPTSHKGVKLLLNRIHHSKSQLLEDADFDIVQAAKKGYHIISVAYIGLTFFSYVCEYGFGIKQPQQEEIITPVNEKKETGTLYPGCRLTIVPYRYKTSAFMSFGIHDYTNGKGFLIDEVKMQVHDIFKSEIDFVKSGKLVFDFRDLGSDMLRYRNIVEHYLTTSYKDNDWEVFIYSADNSEWD
jgi:hypothetical protein